VATRAEDLHVSQWTDSSCGRCAELEAQVQHLSAALAECLDATGSGEVLLGPAPALPPRSWDVLELIARGLTNREIAAELIVSPHTVKTHVKRAYAAIGVTTRAAATRWYLEHRRHRPAAA
jgi:DNA-binding NarL/FixJ family response regulator